MSDSEFLDFDKLAQPCEGESATGPDLRKDYSPDSVYRKIKDARARAGKAEKDAWNDQASAAADWAEIVTLAPPLLYNDSKDLEVACWLTEAMLRSYGFAGLRDGFRACTVLVEHFWDTLHPNPDPEDDDEEEGLIRVAALSGLNGGEYQGTLINPIRSVDLVDSSDPGRWGLSGFEQAVALQGIEDYEEREKRMEHGAVTLEMFADSGRATSPDFFERLSAELDEARQWYDKLIEAIEQRCPPELCPPSSGITNALADSRQRLDAFITEYAPQLAGYDEPSEDAQGGEGAAAPSGGKRVDGPIQSREQAFSLIHQAADYFRKTEPHSVLSWQLEECIKWGKMTLPDLLKELISDETARDSVYKRVGIPPPKTDEEI